VKGASKLPELASWRTSLDCGLSDTHDEIGAEQAANPRLTELLVSGFEPRVKGRAATVYRSGPKIFLKRAILWKICGVAVDFL
jgi:hypothetical protein